MVSFSFSSFTYMHICFIRASLFYEKTLLPEFVGPIIQERTSSPLWGRQMGKHHRVATYEHIIHLEHEKLSGIHIITVLYRNMDSTFPLHCTYVVLCHPRRALADLVFYVHLSVPFVCSAPFKGRLKGLSSK